MRKTVNQAAQLANVDSTVLITDESGTGKETMAKSMHFSGIIKI
jgi:transcriptional regulator with PAS, ATPase and Fis domain